MPDEILDTPAAAPVDVATTPAPVPATPVPTTGDTTAVAASDPAPASGTESSAAAVAEYFEATVDGKPFQIPKSAQFPWKRGEETGFHTLDQITKSPQLYEDYQRKTAEVAAQRRAIQEQESQIERTRVEMEARLESARTARQRLIEAQAKGGAELERELRHQELMETDEEYRERFQQSEEYRISERLSKHDADQDRLARTESATQRASDYIRHACEAAPGVDPEKVRRIYALALQTGHADLDQASVDRIIAEEKAGIDRTVQPLSTEMAALKKQVAELQAQLQANSHNARVTQAIDRATGAQPGKPANGNPPAPKAGLKPFNPATDNEADWLRQWNQIGVS